MPKKRNKNSKLKRHEDYNAEIERIAERLFLTVEKNDKKWAFADQLKKNYYRMLADLAIRNYLSGFDLEAADARKVKLCK